MAASERLSSLKDFLSKTEAEAPSAGSLGLVQDQPCPIHGGSNGGGAGSGGGSVAALSTGVGGGVDGVVGTVVGPPSGAPAGSAAPTAPGSLRAQIVELSLEVEDKAATITTLQEALKKARVATEVAKRSGEAELKKKLGAQKATYEAAMHRHLEFVDQLLADKGALSEQVETLSSRLATVDKAWESRVRSVKERAAVEMKRAQDAWAAGEKVRKDAWTRAKEKQIKEATIKGLEPEIQRILDRQRSELERLRTEYEQRGERERADAAARHGEELARARLSVDAKVLEALDGERKQLLVRERDMREQLEEEAKATRTRCALELEGEQRRHAEAMREERARHAEEMARLRAGYEDRLDAMLRREEAARHDSELRVSGAVAEEQKEWRRAMAAQMRQEQEAREQDLRQELTRQRDEQIKMVISRLDGEARQERSVLQQDFDTRLAAAEARHRDTVKSLERQVRELEVQTMQSTTAVQSRERVLMAEVEGLKEDLSAAREELELLRLEAITSNRLAEDCQMQLDAVRAARSKDRDELRQETEDKVRALVEDKSRLQEQLAALQAKARLEMEGVVKQHATELEQLEVRVRSTVAQRDDTISALKEKLDEAELRRRHAETLLARQRQELLAASS